MVLDRCSGEGQSMAGAKQARRFDGRRVLVLDRLPDRVHQLHVDYSERQSALVDAVWRSGTFDVRMVCLATGDYLRDSRRPEAADWLADLVAEDQHVSRLLLAGHIEA